MPIRSAKTFGSNAFGSRRTSKIIHVIVQIGSTSDLQSRITLIFIVPSAAFLINIQNSLNRDNEFYFSTWQIVYLNAHYTNTVHICTGRIFNLPCGKFRLHSIGQNVSSSCIIQLIFKSVRYIFLKRTIFHQ